MQRVRFERGALRLAADAFQRARAPGVDDDLDQQHDDRDEAEGRRRRSALDAADRFHHDAAGEEQEQRRFAERGDVLEFAVAVGVRGVGRPVGDADCGQRNAGRQEIDAGVQRVGDQRQAADQKADDELRRRENEARGERYGGGPFLQGHRAREFHGLSAFLEANAADSASA